MAPSSSLATPITITNTKGRVLIVGATGFMGKFVAEASITTSHPTYLLVRPGPLISSKASIIKAFQDKGAIVIYVSHNIYLFLIVYLIYFIFSLFVYNVFQFYVNTTFYCLALKMFVLCFHF